MSILKPTEWSTCDHCGQRKRVSDERRGCDVCKKIFDDEEPYLNFTVFRNEDSKTEDVDCCSWDCVLAALKDVKCDHFISLPYLHYDSGTPEGQRGEDFFTAIAKAGQS